MLTLSRLLPYFFIHKSIKIKETVNKADKKSIKTGINKMSLRNIVNSKSNIEKIQIIIDKTRLISPIFLMNCIKRASNNANAIIDNMYGKQGKSGEKIKKRIFRPGKNKSILIYIIK